MAPAINLRAGLQAWSSWAAADTRVEAGMRVVDTRVADRPAAAGRVSLDRKSVV